MSTHYVLKIQYVNKPPETRNIGARVTTLGREAGDIVLGDPQSSGRHAEIHFENGNVRVKDLGSTNGTFYNGQRSPEFALQPGQGFSIGQTVMTLMAIHGAAAQRPGQGKTMIAMGGMPPRPPGPPGAPPGRPPGAPPPGPAGFGAPPPSGPPPGAPPSGPAGFGGPPPGGPVGGPPPGGFGAPPPSGPPAGAPPSGFGAPAGGPGGFGAPPPSSPPGGGFGGPPAGGPPPGGGFGGPPAGGPPPGGFGGPPSSQPGPMAAAGAGFAAATSGPPPQSFGAGPAPMASGSPGGEARGDFSGTGGELLGQLLVGYLLTLITFGIYGPWFICKFANFIAERVTFGPSAKGTVRFRFEGKGGDLFVTALVGYLLSMITFGIYLPWFMCKLTKFYTDNTTAVTDDGTTYKPDFQGTGGDLFVTFLVGYLLTAITFGIYGPWFICKMNKWFAEHTKISSNGQPVGGMDFTGQGGDLLVTFIVGYLLTLVTFGIYMPWFQVKLLAFNADNTKIDVEGKRMGMRFTGQGGELFVIILVGYLLTLVTFGIYMFWFMAKLLKWQLSNTVVFSEGGSQMQMGAGGYGGQVQQQMGAPGPQPGMYGAPPQGQLGGPGAPGGYGGPSGPYA